MQSPLRLGLWEHWFKTAWNIGDFLREKGVPVRKVDYTRRDYLDDLDVLIVGQGAVNDDLENDRDRIHHFVAAGGICLVTHQDAFRCNPCFLPAELGRPLLVSRYYQTLGDGSNDCMSYLMPWIEDAGRAIFSSPNVITPDEFVGWELKGNTFTAAKGNLEPETLFTCAQSALTDVEKWEVLGSYMDPSMPEGSALIMQARYGKGLYFWIQLLFPETKEDPSGRVLRFWERCLENLLTYFRCFKAGEALPPAPPRGKADGAPGWRKTITHLHSLDWYAADNSFGGLNAAMRAFGYDVGVLGFKDALSYHDAPDYAKYCDEKVTLLPGMEYHPFNYNESEKYTSAYHILAMGVTSCRNTFTRSLFDDRDVDEYARSAIDYIHSQGGVACATHPVNGYWRNYDFDAVDTYGFERTGIDPDVLEKHPFRGSEQEKAWLAGSHITLMASVDMWGITRLRRNPVFDLIWFDGPPTAENLVAAIKKGHVIPGFGAESADIRFGKYLPGDTIPPAEQRGVITVKVTSADPLTAVELYADDRPAKTETLPPDCREADLRFDVPEMACRRFLRVEVKGRRTHLVANPFFKA
ncbi:MAG: CehA/McbA family metallohydrolase [Lentisphaeria bacterium]|nr:CehA/McbA family metallohydrolase [Lentisphaeria bacterium]